MSELAETLRELATRHGIPGAVAGVMHDGRVETAASGIANLNTGAEMTPDTLFLTGSITKIWVTTLLMSLAEQGLVDLAAPVKRYVPELALSDAGVAETLTVRHLLTHTTGLDAADLIADLGEDDHAIARYVDLLRDVGQLFPPGRFWSYNNAGFVVAGRIIEKVTGAPFSTVMRQQLFARLQVESSMLTTREAILHRVAIGHYRRGEQSVPSSRFLMPECLAPAGTTLITSVSDTLALARHHLPGNPRHRLLLSDESVTSMASHHVDFPIPGTGSCGLGWMRRRHGRYTVLSHGGGSYGGIAHLMVVPDLAIAYICYANSADSPSFHRDLETEVRHRFGVPAADAPEVDHTRDPYDFRGDYRRWGADFTITDTDGHLVCQPTITAPILERSGIRHDNVHVRPVGSSTLVTDRPNPEPFAYGLGADGAGHPEFLVMHQRVTPRIGQTAG